MSQKVTTGFRAMIDAAEREIENLTVEQRSRSTAATT